MDEIHLFNEKGVIYNGTHPQYYNMSVNDGEQIGFFAKMLDDKSAKLCQDVMPNTATQEMVQTHTAVVRLHRLQFGAVFGQKLPNLAENAF